MRIDYAGGRRKKSARALQRWFNLANLGWLKPAQIVDAIGRRQGPDALYLSQLTMFTGKDELADPTVRYGVARAVIIKAVAPLAAQVGFERAWLIIYASLDNFTAARTCSRSTAFSFVQNDTKNSK